MQQDTIAAVATAPGRGAVGIVRLSGPQAFAIAERLAGPKPPPRHAALRTFADEKGEALDQGLVLLFARPESYTGEDVVELQGHGGPLLLDLLVRAACALGARPARPGEFSERAFLNGRLDLAQAEAIADLISASTAEAARAAQRSLSGEFSTRVRALVEEVTALRAYVEGALDFPDEDVDWLADLALEARLDALLAHLRALLDAAAQGRRLREGMVVALAGQPNVGKSTLLNLLAGTEAAIVTEVPGTTRDLLRENISLEGLPLTVVDTAGLRESDDPVEKIGIERAWGALGHAELVLFLVDDRAGTTGQDRALLERVPKGAEVIVVRNKCDLSGETPSRTVGDGGRVELRLCARSGDGLDLLKAEIRRAAGLTATGESLFSARTRHVDALQRALACATDAERRLGERAAPELAAEDLRLAQQALGEITGAVGSDDLLGRIFSQFCIGK
ncbi:MAG: tRNA uridine-5-carboxymethylaminomethyl(34) synthesis GTPase MnmE [Gammaproteobacteria bacterium]